MNRIELLVGDAGSGGIRIDKYVTDILGDVTRSQLKLRARDVFVNGENVKLSKKVFPGDRIEIDYLDPVSTDLEPEAIEFDILYENNDVIVLNKPQGLVVHPAAGNPRGTLVNGLIHHCQSIQRDFQGDTARPGIVHRLDKDTSGVLIVAKNPYAQEFLSSQFRRRKVRKTYLAITVGHPLPLSGKVEGWIDRDRRNRKKFVPATRHGKQALTIYRTIRRHGNYAFVELRPVTGRTHQLRVHMKQMCAPILGDPVYNRRDDRYPDAGLMLHAHTLCIRIPGEIRARTFRALLPDRMKNILAQWVRE